MELTDNKLLNIGALFVATIVVIKFIVAISAPGSGKKRLPPSVKALPVIGGLIRFMKGPIIMIREEYQKLGSVFTVNLLNRKITFFVGPEVSSHFFKAPEADLSQQEVYQFNVPTFGPGVVFDVDYSVRQEQFRFFTEALRVMKLKSYVDQMVVEAEDYFSKWGESGTVDLKYELEHLITHGMGSEGRPLRVQASSTIQSWRILLASKYQPVLATRKEDRGFVCIERVMARACDACMYVCACAVLNG